MATEIRMPQFGVSMETGTVAQWLKAEGDTVKAGDVLASIETEKLTNDVVSEVDGVLLNKDATQLVAFPAAKKLPGGTYTAPESVRQVADNAFNGAQVTKVNVPDGLARLSAQPPPKPMVSGPER